jgi:glycosyltransferase involved in cell wall biosynthesis
MPSATIVTATYNKPAYLREAGLSVLGQTRGDWRWWVVLDGADEETAAVALDFQETDPRVTVFEEHVAAADRWVKEYRPAALINKYYPLVTTRFLAWLSDDDVLEPCYLEVLAGELDRHLAYDVVFGTCEVVRYAHGGTAQPHAWLRADRAFGVGTDATPGCNIDGGQILQTKRSYDALGGWQLPTDFQSASSVDAIYMNQLAERFTFVPVARKVMTHRRTPASSFKRD